MERPRATAPVIHYFPESLMASQDCYSSKKKTELLGLFKILLNYEIQLKNK